MTMIDQFQQAAHERPHEPLAAGVALTNQEAWARSGAVASWLIAQGYGPGARSIAMPEGDRAQKIVIFLGAVRAGAAIVEGGDKIAYGPMANCSIDAAVAERRLHIDASASGCRNIEDVVQLLK